MAEPVTFTERLRQWYAERKATGEVVDIDFFLGDCPGSVEDVAREVYGIVTGATRTVEDTEEPL